MREKVTLEQQRLILARLSVSMLRVMVGTYLRQENFGSNCADILLCNAVLVGQLERKPMTAAHLATYCGMPRPTVTRRLADLSDRGLVLRGARGRYALPLERIEAPLIGDAIVTLKRLIHDAARDLSKLDT